MWRPMPGTRYVHTNIVARDWRRLAAFYRDVFDCRPVGPERDLHGGWVDRLTSLEGARITGAHLLMPGHGEEGPTLEIFAYEPAGAGELGPIHRPGLGHLAFHVDDVEAVRSRVLAHGGQAIGEVVRRDYPALGRLTAVYVRDPEGNPIELQHWDRPT
jgi:catechol 2,3-dioxygenase-like lactoylglutathione lyase family enzyme